MSAKPDSLAQKLWAAESRSAVALAALEAAHSFASRTLADHAASRPHDFDEAAAQVELARASVADATEGTSTADAIKAKVAADREANSAALANHASVLEVLTAEATQAEANVVQARRVADELMRSRVTAVAAAAGERLVEARLEYARKLLGLADLHSDLLALRALVRSPERSTRDAVAPEAKEFIASAGWSLDGSMSDELGAIGARHHVDGDAGELRISAQDARVAAVRDFWALAAAIAGADVGELQARGQAMPVGA